jgi:hypothetical protein
LMKIWAKLKVQIRESLKQSVEFYQELERTNLRVTSLRTSQCPKSHGMWNVVDNSFSCLTSHLFSTNSGAVIDEHGACFNQELSIMQKRYKVSQVPAFWHAPYTKKKNTETISTYILGEFNMQSLLWYCYCAFKLVKISFSIRSELVGDRQILRSFSNSS